MLGSNERYPRHRWLHGSRYVVLDGKHFPTAPNLEAALQRLRSHTDNLDIWVYAICIDQSNDNERSAQVKEMRHIYSGAKTIRVRLGESYGDSSYAFEILRELSSAAEAKIPEDAILAEYSLNQHTDRSKQREALVQLFQRVYWNRAWIIQEIVSKPCGIIFTTGHYHILSAPD